MTAVFPTLPPFSWRGKKYPVSARSVSFAHESVQHKLQRRNQDLVEQTGAHNLVLTYTIPMREGIFKGPYRNLFVEGFPVLFADVRNRTPGDLVDQFYGPLRCVPASWNDDSDVLKTDGTDVRIEFHHAPEDGEEEAFAFPTVRQVLDDGRNLSVDIQSLTDAPLNDAEQAAAQEFKQLESERGGTDLLSAINGIGQQVIGLGERGNAAIDDLIFRAEKIETTAEKLSSPNGWLIRDRSRQMRDLAIRTRNGRTTATRKVRNAFARSITSIAAAYSVTLQALIDANPGIARSPIVPAGAVILIPTNGQS